MTKSLFVGEYICRAFNSCGASTSKCFLSVSGMNAPPSAPTNLECTGVTSNHVTLSWKPACYQGHFGGAPIDGYLIEKFVKRVDIKCSQLVFLHMYTSQSCKRASFCSPYPARARNHKPKPGPIPTFIFEARFQSASQIYPVRQDMRNCRVFVA